MLKIIDQPIGEFELDGIKLECVEDDYCYKCSFNQVGSKCLLFECRDYLRKDNKNVIFITKTV